jgi:hypothetical protein
MPNDETRLPIESIASKVLITLVFAFTVVFILLLIVGCAGLIFEILKTISFWGCYVSDN